MFFCNYTEKNKISTGLKPAASSWERKPDLWSMNELKEKLKVFLNQLSMNRVTDRIQVFFESYAFGVCTRLGEKLGMATSSIRLFFIYASFITFGSPIIVYLSLAFIMNIRKHLRKRNPIWDY